MRNQQFPEPEATCPGQSMPGVIDVRPNPETACPSIAQEMISALQSALLDPGPAGRAMLSQMLCEEKQPSACQLMLCGAGNAVIPQYCAQVYTCSNWVLSHMTIL